MSIAERGRGWATEGTEISEKSPWTRCSLRLAGSKSNPLFRDAGRSQEIEAVSDFMRFIDALVHPDRVGFLFRRDVNFETIFAVELPLLQSAMADADLFLCLRH